MIQGLKPTPFHERTAELCESHSWRRWAGHVVAGSYDLSHEREYHAIRNAAGLLDVSPLYKYMIRGRDAVRLLDRVITRDASVLQPGEVLYTGWCNAAGKMLDDGTVARLSEQVFRMTSADPNLRWLQDNASGLEVALEDVSGVVGALALQGPASRTILQQLGDFELKYFGVAEGSLGGVPVSVSRTGFTGDLGYEIWVGATDAVRLWDALIEAGKPFGITPAGMLALDVARIEAGLMLLDVDYVSARKALTDSQTSTPYELDLGWTVDLGKERFVGRDALAVESARDPLWKFVGLEVDWDSLESLHADAGLAPRVPHAAWRTSLPLYSGGEQAGYATSGVWSPLLKKYIVLAQLRSAWARPGTRVDMEVTVEHRRKRASAQVVKKPFFNPERKRS